MKKSQHRKVVKARQKVRKRLSLQSGSEPKKQGLGLKSVSFLTFGVKKVFTKLRQAFVEAPILNHFDPEHYIQIKTDVSGYAIGGILSQLTLDDLGQWHLVAFFSRKMIITETQYETHKRELLAIVEVFKTWRHYLED